jgi:DNA uptake protein ComE-like DNA-binding protein
LDFIFKEVPMSKRLLTASVIAALSLVAACDNQGAKQQEEETVRQEQTSLPEGEVIDSSSKVIERTPAEMQAEQQIEKGSEDVQYTTKRQVTETVQKEQEIPTIEKTQTKANINEMDVADFVALGFDQRAAQQIVQTRDQRGGNFNSVDELMQINGVSKDTFNRVRNNLGVAPQQAQEEK